MQLTEDLGAPSSIGTVVFVGGSSIQLAASNPLRRHLALYNGGSNPIFRGYGPTAVASQGLPLAVGVSDSLDALYTGQLAAITGVGTTPIFVRELY